MESCSLLIVPHFRLNVDSDSSEALVTVVSHFSGVKYPQTGYRSCSGGGDESRLEVKRKGRGP